MKIYYTCPTNIWTVCNIQISSEDYKSYFTKENIDHIYNTIVQQIRGKEIQLNQDLFHSYLFKTCIIHWTLRNKDGTFIQEQFDLSYFRSLVVNIYLEKDEFKYQSWSIYNIYIEVIYQIYNVFK